MANNLVRFGTIIVDLWYNLNHRIYNRYNIALIYIHISTPFVLLLVNIIIIITVCDIIVLTVMKVTASKFRVLLVYRQEMSIVEFANAASIALGVARACAFDCMKTRAGRTRAGSPYIRVLIYFLC